MLFAVLSQLWSSAALGAARWMVLAAGGINISPNTQIPGTTKIESLVGGTMTLALAGAVLAVVAGGGAWAFGERRANFTTAHVGRRLVEGGLLGGVIIGGASALINQAFGIGVGF